MSMAKAAFAQGIVAGLIAQMTFREAVRQRLIAGFLLAALIMVAGVHGLRSFNFGTSELRFVLDLGFGMIGLLGSMLAIAVTTVLMFNELERRTVLTILARPVTRGAYLSGKWLGASSLLGVHTLTLTLALVAVLSWRGDPNVRFADVWVAGLLQALKLGALAAFTLVLATLCRTALLTAVLAFFVLVICQLQPVLAELATGVERPEGRIVAGAIVACVPDFQAFDLTGALARGERIPWQQAAGLALYGMGYCVAACAVATAIFQRREL